MVMPYQKFQSLISKVSHEYTTLFLVLKEHSESQVTNAGILPFSIFILSFVKV